MDVLVFSRNKRFEGVPLLIVETFNIFRKYLAILCASELLNNLRGVNAVRSDFNKWGGVGRGRVIRVIGVIYTPPLHAWDRRDSCTYNRVPLTTRRVKIRE